MQNHVFMTHCISSLQSSIIKVGVRSPVISKPNVQLILVLSSFLKTLLSIQYTSLRSLIENCYITIRWFSMARM